MYLVQSTCSINAINKCNKYYNYLVSCSFCLSVTPATHDSDHNPVPAHVSPSPLCLNYSYLGDMIQAVFLISPSGDSRFSAAFWAFFSLTPLFTSYSVSCSSGSEELVLALVWILESVSPTEIIYSESVSSCIKWPGGFVGFHVAMTIYGKENI